ncbi:cyclophilin [Haematococcus lacustris]
MGSRVFLDIDIGDPAEYAEQLAQYTRAGEYLASVGMQLGLPQQAPESLDEEQQQLLLEAYSADRQWSSKGPAACIKPVPLRAGRLVIQLMEAECPRTCANFKALATGEKGVGKASKKPLHYKGNRMHRIVKSFCAQGGDIVRGDGSGGDSIYGGVFNDEKKGLGMKHDRLGVVAMANSGKNSNTSQFFITLGPAPQCDGKHVVFGMVVEGMEVLHRLNEEAASEDGTPRVVVTVADCGLC